MKPRPAEALLLLIVAGAAAQPSGVVLNFDELCGARGTTAAVAGLEAALRPMVAGVSGVQDVTISNNCDGGGAEDIPGPFGAALRSAVVQIGLGSAPEVVSRAVADLIGVRGTEPGGAGMKLASTLLWKADMLSLYPDPSWSAPPRSAAARHGKGSKGGEGKGKNKGAKKGAKETKVSKSGAIHADTHGGKGKSEKGKGKPSKKHGKAKNTSPRKQKKGSKSEKGGSKKGLGTSTPSSHGKKFATVGIASLVASLIFVVAATAIRRKQALEAAASEYQRPTLSNAGYSMLQTVWEICDCSSKSIIDTQGSTYGLPTDSPTRPGRKGKKTNATPLLTPSKVSL